MLSFSLVYLVSCEVVVMEPAGQRVISPGRSIEFLCYASVGHIVSIQWNINNTRHDLVNISLNEIVNFNAVNAEGSLILQGISLNLNNTSVRCLANFTSGTTLSSQECNLIVQGSLCCLI